MKRIDGRLPRELRPVSFELNYIRYPEGSVLITCGHTKVLCNATVEESVPNWMKGAKKPGGWITAEYAMLPRATHTRSNREASLNGSRSQEIRRLVGRALRASVPLEELGPRTIAIDCDVIQADGGTRTASITGGYVALALALAKLRREGKLSAHCKPSPVSAVSAGIVKGKVLLDLCYEEDSSADADANFVFDRKGRIIEVQGTAEKDPFTRAQLDELLSVASQGAAQLIKLQEKALKAAGRGISD